MNHRFLQFTICIWLFGYLGLQSVVAQSRQQCDSLIADAVRLLEKDENLKSITQLSKVKTVAHQNNWYLQEFNAINNIGNNYYSIAEYAESLNFYTQAYAIAIKHLKSDSEMIVLNNIAILYSGEKKFDQAKEYFNRALELAERNNNYEKMSLYLLNLGNLYEETKQYKLAKTYYERALAKSAKESRYKFYAQLGLIKKDLYDGNNQKAIDDSEKLVVQGNESKIKQLSRFGILAKAHLNLNKLDIAELYATRFFDFKLNYQEKIAAFELLSEIAQKKKAYEKALMFKDSIIANHIKDYELKNEKTYLNNKSRFEILKYKNQIQENRIASEKDKMLLYVSLIIIVALFVIIWLSYRNYKTRAAMDSKNFAKKEENLIQLIEKEKKEIYKIENENLEAVELLNYEKQELSKEIEFKNRKNTAKALHLAERNLILETIIAELSEVKNVKENTTLTRSLKKLKQHLASSDELSNFMVHFEEINQLFLNNLKQRHPNLNGNDIRFLSYVYVNLNTKEISNLLNITLDACRKRKERIIKKINLDSDTDLYIYLNSL